MRRRLTLMVFMVVVILITACNGAALSVGAGTAGDNVESEAASDETRAPDTEAPDTEASDETESQAADTTPPPETEPPETEPPDTAGGDGGDTGDEETDGTETEDGGGIDARTIWIVVGLVAAFILLGWLMGRSRKPSPPQSVATAPPPLTWKDHLRDGYEEGLWLVDSITEDLAIWRANHILGVEAGDAETALADRWGQLDIKANQARNHLYKAEARAPDQRTSGLIRDCIDGINDARAAVDASVEAHVASASAEGDASAAARERVASTNLAEARAALNTAVTTVGGLL